MIIYHEPFPCKTCTKRHIGCHAGCEEYLQAKEKHEAKRKKVIEAKNEQVQADGVTINNIDRLLKKYHMKGR